MTHARTTVLLTLCGCLTVGLGRARAQEARPPGADAAVPMHAPRKMPEPPTAAERALGIEIKADEVEYDDTKQLMTARGNVVIRQGKDILKSDFMSLRTDTQEAHAIGNVTYEREGYVWRGHEIVYNLKTQQGDFGKFNATVPPFYVRAEESRRVSSEEFVMKRVTITTCEGDRPQFFMKAGEARLRGRDKLVAKNATFWLVGVPIFWVPYWIKSLHGDDTQIEIVPGYSTRMGAYLLMGYNYRINPGLKASTQLGPRTRRGLGLGQEFMWGGKGYDYRGYVAGYYINDQDPLAGRNEDEKASLEDLVDADRYRLRLSDTHALTERDYVATELHYVSDPAFLEDYFDDEFRHNVAPENRVSVVHRGDHFTAGLQLNTRLNDFYENVNRLPEAWLDVSRIRIFETPFYYQSQNSAGWLEKVFPEQNDQDSYSAFRADSAHTVFYPDQYFGFLNVIPRVGYRGTYYSETYQVSTESNTVYTVDTNGLLVVTNEIRTVVKDDPGLRNLYELGFETSMKAFGVLTEEWLDRDNRGLRHVVEPYSYYTYVPEPNLRPDDLLQFDAVDRLDKRNDIVLGVRNKFQTRRKTYVHDLVYVDVWTTYFLEPEDDQNSLGDAYFKTNLRLADWVPIDLEGGVDTENTELTTFDGRVTLVSRDASRLGVEYIYRRDSAEQIAGDLYLFPNQRWSFGVYARYSLDRSELEEHSYFVQHQNDCIGVGAGIKQVDEDWQAWLQIWLVALPSSNVKLGL